MPSQLCSPIPNLSSFEDKSERLAKLQIDIKSLSHFTIGLLKFLINFKYFDPRK